MEDVELRLATPRDAEVLFAWRNDPDTRRNSASVALVTWEEHVRWIERTLADPSRRLYVAYLGDDAVGTVRLDFADEAVISITVAPPHRGKRLAVALIRAACVAARGRRVVASIRPENVPSIRAFERAGFHYVGVEAGVLRYAFDSAE
jgi:RimJ/RimL family protein N-acetyltransferase